jgi:hypothetical protein
MLGKRYLEEGTLSQSQARQFRNGIADLVSIYKEHVCIEDDLVFPNRRTDTVGSRQSHHRGGNGTRKSRFAKLRSAIVSLNSAKPFEFGTVKPPSEQRTRPSSWMVGNPAYRITEGLSVIHP